MKKRVGVWFALLPCMAVEAADPPAHAVAPPPVRAIPSTVAADAGKPAKPLDLRVGDVRNYMMPRDFQAALKAPDADSNTVVVEGQREIAPMRMVEDVPPGLASLWYAAKDPKNSWRLLAPMVTFKDGPTYDKVPPPVFRWGP
jgi:hypothetical protein